MTKEKSKHPQVDPNDLSPRVQELQQKSLISPPEPKLPFSRKGPRQLSLRKTWETLQAELRQPSTETWQPLIWPS